MTKEEDRLKNGKEGRGQVGGGKRRKRFRWKREGRKVLRYDRESEKDGTGKARIKKKG